MLWLGERGRGVFLPLVHSPDYDLIADWGDGSPLTRVQVKTSTLFATGRWEVSVCYAWRQSELERPGQALGPDPVRPAVRARRRRPALVHSRRRSRGRKRRITLGGPKYAEYEIEPGEPLPAWVASLDSAPLLAGFPSGQRDETVNPLAQPSQVRILLPPLRVYSTALITLMTDGEPEPDGADVAAAAQSGSPEMPRSPSDSAERLRRLRQADRHPAQAADRRRAPAAERLPGDEQFGDPLSTAGRHPVEVIARGVSAAAARPESLVQELGLGRPPGLAVAVGGHRPGAGRSRSWPSCSPIWSASHAGR